MVEIKLLVEGGNMKPGPTVGQKLGPLGVNVGQVISKVNDATKEFRGLKVPVTLEIDAKTKKIEVSVATPPILELIKKEAGIVKGSGEATKTRVANLAIEQIIKIAKTKQQNMLVNNLKSAVKSVIGSCVSSGILIESKEPKEVLAGLEKGVYDKEINSEKTEVNLEKSTQLKEFIDKIIKQQELKKKAAEKEAEEKKAAEAATAATTPETATEKKVEEVKPEKKAPAKK